VSDTFQDPDSLLKFFTILATSSGEDLGFDTNIEKVGESDFDIQFSIDGKKYHTTKLLFDIGADAPTGRGSRVFEVDDPGTGGKRVIKDCWVEDRPGKEMEHSIVVGIKMRMDEKEFCQHFIDVHGHHKKEMSGRFGEVWKLLNTETSKSTEGIETEPLIPPIQPTSAYAVGTSVANQDHLLQPTENEPPPSHLPHPRFRYQIIYEEKGISLFEVPSFGDVFVYISEATEGAGRGV
jgi:hypothetical protein